MKLYNTLTRQLEAFEPLDDDRVRMYVCGPTVYDYIHIGNARPFIVFDAFHRYLEYLGYEVTFVQNITDVDDKIIDKAVAEGVPSQEIAERFTQAYWDDLARLNVKRADHEPKATETIPEMIEFVEHLIDGGYAYELDGDVYFRVRQFEPYGKLSGRSVDELEAGARVEVDERKEDPLDFAVWKAAKAGEPAWDSPWGKGRPGWHLECSVMATSYLGETIDIHCGGLDLVFPHHENETAQSEAATGRTFARFWMHNGLLQFEGEKMSKSLGNFEFTRDVVDMYGAEAVRYFYLTKHYRSPVNFTYDAMNDAQQAVERVYHLLEEIEHTLQGREDLELDEDRLSEGGGRFLHTLRETKAQYRAHMDDDFNTAGAIGAIFELVHEANRFRQSVEASDLPLLAETRDLIRELGEPLGMFQAAPWREAKGELTGDLVALLIDVRRQLREQKDFQLADQIRDQLHEMGIELKDKGEETVWSYR
ncbi:MAG: cysteine--tRNA ligase [Candidatus Bipolaricaulia bacterium]